MANSDPFRGLRLSEQAPAEGKVEQRLFTSDPPKRVPTPMPKPATTRGPLKPEATSKQASTSPNAASDSTSPMRAPDRKAPRAARHNFNLNDDPLYKASYLFTQEELEKLEDLKLELRRDLDTKVTKNDLIRSALHMLLEDHSTNGARSYVARKIRQR